MEKIVTRLQALLPDVTFTSGDSFFWSPQQRLITYCQKNREDKTQIWALLHETSHAMLDHQSYRSDFELLMLEVEAWEKANQLGDELGIEIDQDHVQDCLDTYRDWLHRRSKCPTCGTVSLQKNSQLYACHNCHTEWTVSTSRFCRPYRRRSSSSSKPLASREIFNFN